MDLLALAQRIHRESGRSGSGPTSLATATKDHLRLFDWAADSWLNLQSMPREWAWMRRSLTATVTGASQRYTGAALAAAQFGRWREHGRTYTVRAFLPAAPASVWRLKWQDEDRFTALFLDLATTPAPPQHWGVSATEELLIGPLPDQSYTVLADYFIEPQALLAETDEPGMPLRHHMLLVWRALIEVAKFDAAPELLARASANYDLMLSSLIADQTPPIAFEITPLA